MCQEIPGGQPECRCLPGFFGDGLYCYEHTGVEIPGLLLILHLIYVNYFSTHFTFCVDTSQPDCRQVRDLCHPYAECIYSRSSDSFICSCQTGYVGDGLECHQREGEATGTLVHTN